jgi:D-alanyl-D-alanine carboxypeptidase/D-alanyl-D-alanine-endopeptidase (penicillin-binding protein 4)
MRALRTAAALLLTGCAGAHVARPSAPSPPEADARAALRGFVDSMVLAPEFRSAHWGVLVVDPERGDTLYARNADKLFLPASNMKLVTMAVGLAQLGPDFRWATTLLARGRVRGGVLEGDLVVRGNGDPSFSTHMRGDARVPFQALADSLRAHGITRVWGNVVAAPSPFPGDEIGYGWEASDLDAPYGAGVSALYFNEGFTEIVVRGGARAGDPVSVTMRPLEVEGMSIAATTVARTERSADSSGGGTHLAIGYDSSHAAIRVAGTIAAGDSAVLQLASRHLTQDFLTAFRSELFSRGIRVGEPRPAGAAPADTTVALDSIVSLSSPSLAEVLPYLAKPSQNQIAELLFKTIAVHATGVGSADSASRVVERQLVAWGAAPDGFAVRDGSGMSRHDYLSPRTLVRVLDVMRRRPDFHVYYDALPVAGVDGTLDKRMLGTAAAGNVHAKTGYVDKARSLSGYVTTADGRLLLFSALCNNYTVPTREAERVQDALAARLATLRLPAT